MVVLMLTVPAFGAAQGLGGDPDLAIIDVQISPELPKPSESATIILTIANQGDGDVARTDRVDVEFLISFGPKDLSNVGLGLLDDIRIDKQTLRTGIDVGETTEISFNWTVVELPQFEFILKLDSSSTGSTSRTSRTKGSGVLRTLGS